MLPPGPLAASRSGPRIAPHLRFVWFGGGVRVKQQMRISQVSVRQVQSNLRMQIVSHTLLLNYCWCKSEALVCSIRLPSGSLRKLLQEMQKVAGRKRPRDADEIINTHKSAVRSIKRRPAARVGDYFAESTAILESSLRALRFEALSCLAKRAPSVLPTPPGRYAPQPMDSVCTDVSNWIILICRHMRIYRATCHAALSMWRRVLASVSSKQSPPNTQHCPTPPFHRWICHS